MPPATGIVISGLGMVSSLGFDVVTSCAAQRAGLTWRHPLAQVVAYDEAELEAPVTGAPIEGYTNGFIQSGTWVRMAVTALEDLVDYGQLPGREDARFWQTTGVAWVLPPLLFERFFWPDPEVPALLEAYCADLLARLTQLPLQMIPGGFITGGPHGVATAVQRAEALFTRSSMERVLILGTDSWLDRPSINLLIREGRLKTSERPVGLCPSESAACVLVERALNAGQRGARAESRILAAVVQDAPDAPSEEDAPVRSRSQLAPEWGRKLARLSSERWRPPESGSRSGETSCWTSTVRNGRRASGAMPSSFSMSRSTSWRAGSCSPPLPSEMSARRAAWPRSASPRAPTCGVTRPRTGRSSARSPMREAPARC
ncbi:hypothetical protein HV824_00930 [Myxococcus sp. AM009]|uniref:hypothetical protein n=1 Tax=Myxococcus sp. AM009 TaxID=2745137 RepID=UPI00159611B0|nr:hypothetical protein [Myxococcus sp. AM009]NVI96688.1 hypothetical protein [Myxococcus sp. AM009]